MEFGQIEFLNGVFSIIFVILSLVVGIKIILKYISLKKSTFIYMGLTWIGITSPWWGSSISFIVGLFNNGQGISLELYLLVTITLIPLFFMFYLKALTDLLWQKTKKIILTFYGVIGLIFTVAYVYFIIYSPTFIGILKTPVDIQYRNFASLYLIFTILTFFVGGILFGITSLKSEHPTVRLQGKLLILAFCSFCVGSVLDASIDLDVLGLFITRIVLISSALEFYSGFILPSFLIILFIKS
ncbi:MAG: hypothetical protein ACQERB_16825 [Promethearchaeati archaeon]